MIRPDDAGGGEETGKTPEEVLLAALKRVTEGDQKDATHCFVIMLKRTPGEFLTAFEGQAGHYASEIVALLEIVKARIVKSLIG